MSGTRQPMRSGKAPTRRWAGACARRLVLALCLATGGCYQRVVRDTWAEYRDHPWGASEQDGPDTPLLPAAQASDLQRGREAEWTILIQRFKGPSAKRDATALMERLRREHGMRGLWLDHGEERAHLARGRYGSRHAPATAPDLQDVRMLTLNGARPFDEASLVPVDSLTSGSSLDVRQFAGVWPYTLQVAVFDLRTPAASRSAAEAHAANLRARDHAAYYYHGDHRSMVTVGLFSDDDRIPISTKLPSGKVAHQYIYGPRIRALQRQLPHNLVNGEKHMMTLPDGSQVPQPSSLVPIR